MGTRGRTPLSTTTAADVHAFRRSGSWRRLATLAKAMVDDAGRAAGVPLLPLLGGGTRLMLALNHRISQDIDLFIRDPQWIGYLSPRLNDRVADLVNRYEEDAQFLKLRLADGEIDFIVAMSLLGLPAEHSEESDFELEPVAEVLAKKLFYRGWALTPRDLFDWWFVRTRAPELAPTKPLAELLVSKLDGIAVALSALGASARTQSEWSLIRAPELPLIEAAIGWANGELAILREEQSRLHRSEAATIKPPGG